MFTSGASLIGNYNEYKDLDNRIFQPSRTYDPIEGFFVSNMGENGAVVYDVISILANFGMNVGNAELVYKRLANIGRLSESDLEIFLRAVAFGQSSVTIKNKAIELL